MHTQSGQHVPSSSRKPGSIDRSKSGLGEDVGPEAARGLRDVPGWAWQMVSVAQGLETGLKSVLGGAGPKLAPWHVMLLLPLARGAEQHFQSQKMLLKSFIKEQERVSSHHPCLAAFSSRHRGEKEMLSRKTRHLITATR